MLVGDLYGCTVSRSQLFTSNATLNRLGNFSRNILYNACVNLPIFTLFLMMARFRRLKM